MDRRRIPSRSIFNKFDFSVGAGVLSLFLWARAGLRIKSEADLIGRFLGQWRWSAKLTALTLNQDTHRVDFISRLQERLRDIRNWKLLGVCPLEVRRTSVCRIVPSQIRKRFDELQFVALFQARAVGGTRRPTDVRRTVSVASA